jgi:hypothetical protein
MQVTRVSVNNQTGRSVGPHPLGYKCCEGSSFKQYFDLNVQYLVIANLLTFVFATSSTVINCSSPCII